MRAGRAGGGDGEGRAGRGRGGEGESLSAVPHFFLFLSSLPHKQKPPMLALSNTLSALKALQAKPHTYSDLAPLQAAIDEADAARYVPGVTASDEQVEAIDEAYGEMKERRHNLTPPIAGRDPGRGAWGW